MYEGPTSAAEPALPFQAGWGGAPDGPARLYPPALSERAASLLPDGDRPAVLLTVAVDRGGQATLRSARRARVHSRAQLAYGPAPVAGLPSLLPELARPEVECQE